MGSDLNRNLLFVGGGHADIPMILAAKRLGYRVITTGNRPSDLGHQHSDAYEYADFSDSSQILALARKHDVQAICPSCNDFAALSSAEAAYALKLPGHDSPEISRLIHHKDEFRKFCQQNSIPVPGLARGFESASAASSYLRSSASRMILKPVDLTGGKGISIVEPGQDPSPSIERAFRISKAGRIVVEEFLSGTRHGFSALLHQGRVAFHFTDNEHYYLNPFMVSGASTPARVPTDAVTRLIAVSEKIARALGLQSGIFHVQFILTPDGPVLIEVCRRPPGDLYVTLVQHATGVDYPEWILRGFLGESDFAPNHHPPQGNYIRHCVMPSKSGILRQVNVSNEIRKNIIDSMMWWTPGMRVDDPMTTKFGIVFLKFSSRAEMTEKAEILDQLIQVEMEQVDAC